MKDMIQDRIWTLLTVVVVLLVVAGGIYYTYPLIRRYQNLRQQEADCRTRLHEIEVEKTRVEDLTRRFKTDEKFQLSVARENRLYHPREYVIIFGDDNSSK